jgi:hypothetical protein
MEQQGYPPAAALEIVQQILADHNVDAEAMLAALATALVDRHVDVELRRLGRREPYPIHNERADALKAVNDAIHQAHAKLPAGAGEQEETLRAAMALLMQCQFAAEAAAGIGGDDDGDDEPPPMRLVRE